MKVVVLADTHVRAGAVRRLPETADSLLRKADVILHAGDVLTADFLSELAELAPVHAVLGNNDTELVGRLPVTQELELDGVAVAMIHDAGPVAGRPARMRRRFPSAQVVVFGHSHQPECATEDGQLLLNPGSPTQRRRAPNHTLGLLNLRRGRIQSAEIVTLD